MTTLLIMLAGGLGSVARLIVDGAMKQRLAGTFPWATLLINVSGSLLLGVLTGLVMFHGSPSELKAVLGTGFCGGYTTFSTASIETVRLVQRGSGVQAVGYALGSALVPLGAAALGLLLAG